MGALCTLNLTVETLVQKENFPCILKGCLRHYICKVGKKGFVPVESKDFSNKEAGKTLLEPNFHQSCLERAMKRFVTRYR